jgi:hypothetical protein
MNLTTRFSSVANIIMLIFVYVLYLDLQEERMWQIEACHIIFSDPEEILGSGTHGVTIKARCLIELAC